MQLSGAEVGSLALGAFPPGLVSREPQGLQRCLFILLIDVNKARECQIPAQLSRPILNSLCSRFKSKYTDFNQYFLNQSFDKCSIISSWGHSCSFLSQKRVVLINVAQSFINKWQCYLIIIIKKQSKQVDAFLMFHRSQCDFNTMYTVIK